MDGGRVTVVQVVADVPDGPVMGLEPAELAKLVGDHYREKLEAAIETLTRGGIRADTKVALGSPFLEIVGEAVRGRYDIVVKQAEAHAKQDRIPLGSTDMQLLRMCPHPLWIVKSGRVRRIRNIMVAIDPVPEDAEKNALAAKLLSWGAWPRIHFQAGVASRLIPAAVAAKEIDLLVMGTIGRTGTPGFFIGNTAETVLQKVDCSVLAIKPDGFKTVIEPRAA